MDTYYNKYPDHFGVTAFSANIANLSYSIDDCRLVVYLLSNAYSYGISAFISGQYTLKLAFQTSDICFFAICLPSNEVEKKLVINSIFFF